MTPVIGFIGGGNMARSLMGGLIARDHPADGVIVADPFAEARERVARDYGVRATDDNIAVASAANVLILAVKPQELRTVCQAVAKSVQAQAPLVISVAAGIPAGAISGWLGGVPVVRTMPNRPALYGCGVTALYAMAGVKPDARTLAEEIMSAAGATVWVEQEKHLDAVTAISGSGPAYFFLLIEMLEQAGCTFGLSESVSHRLAVETAYGSGLMARDATETPAILREQVTSKGGTTEAALKVLEAREVRAIFAQALAAAENRSAVLAKTFGAQ
jgi:pyrroline-5-carboxylate reductase